MRENNICCCLFNSKTFFHLFDVFFLDVLKGKGKCLKIFLVESVYLFIYCITLTEENNHIGQLDV